MDKVCSNNSINWLKYDNFITTNNIHIYEDRAILRKWICIKIDLIKII